MVFTLIPKPRVTLMVITDGRLAYLKQTLASFDEMVGMHHITRRIIVNDCSDRAFVDEVDSWDFDEHVRPLERRRGFAGAIQAGWDHLGECDYVLHLEDDFVFERPWDIGDVTVFLNRHPHIAQVALRRQPWNEQERRAGGVIEMWPDQFSDRHAEAFGWHWLEHTLFWTTNPSVYPASIADLGWPQEARSERIFSDRVKALGMINAYWGRREDPPWVRHIGIDRMGGGY